MTTVTSIDPKRLIYFKGHTDQVNSAMITRVCKDHETVSKILTGEFASRTLSNLYNLHAARGIVRNGQLDIKSSMTGPHHYFGFLDPKHCHTIDFHNGLPIYTDHGQSKRYTIARPEVPGTHVLKLHGCRWISGAGLESSDLVNTITGQAIQSDSLFDKPGILEISHESLVFPLVNGKDYDISRFSAQIVPNHIPFTFNQHRIELYSHAQHKLRTVTYNYGDRYADDYLMPGSGIFIERHEFIQAITPMSEECSGYVILGRQVQDTLELIAVTIPFGYTLLVEPWAIHGDSTLRGMYSMAMTGNHNAMKTADTVFMKYKHDAKRNVRITVIPQETPIPSLSYDRLLLTSNVLNLGELYEKDLVLKQSIRKSLDPLPALWWRPVITTGGPSIGWTKTLGVHLPSMPPTLSPLASLTSESS